MLWNESATKYVYETIHEPIWGLAQARVQPKPGLGIGNWNQGPILVSGLELKLSFPKPKLFFFKFSYMGKYKFYKLENKPKSSKII